MTNCLVRLRVVLMAFGLIVAGALFAQEADDTGGVLPEDVGAEAAVDAEAPTEELELGDVSSAEEISTTEILLRREKEIRAQYLIDQAEAELAKGTIEGYQRASDVLIEAEQILRGVSQSRASVREKVAMVERLYATTVREWADHLVARAEAAVTSADETSSAADLDEAERLYRQALDRNQELRPIIRQRMEKVEAARVALDIRSQTLPDVVDPEKVERDRDIRILLEQGKVFFRNRRYMDARDRFEAVLIRDQYNNEATSYLRNIYEELTKDAKARRHVMIRERAAEIEWKWVDPVPPLEPTVTQQRTDTRRSTYGEEDEGIRRKLRTIIIPRISFDDATIQTVVRFLKERSRELDVTGEGVNIILRMPGPGGVAPGAGFEATEPAVDDLDFTFPEGDFGFDGGALDPGADFPPIGGEPAPDMQGPTPTADATITIDMDNIPLEDAIRYIAHSGNLKYRVEQYAVIIADPSIPIEQLETRFYPVDAGFMRAEVTRSIGGFADDDDDDDDAGGAVDPRQFFESLGVEFPQGARISHDPRTSKLIVTNTPESLRKVEEILRELNVQPTQVTIEAKFVEIRQTTLNEIGFKWLFEGKRHSDGSLTGYNQAITGGLEFNVDNQLGSGGGSLSAGISEAVGGVTPGNLLSVTSILDNLQFRTLIYAIDQLEGTDLLSAPKVTTMSGVTAVIDFVQERRFPESFTEPEITTATGGQVSVTPSTPEFGDSEEIGVIFRVTPSVAADGYSIDLELEPVVREFIGFDTTWNTQTVVSGSTIPFRFDVPIFERRSIQTRVIVWDGETVVLGGTIRDVISKRDDQVPWLSELPVFGRLFKMKGELSEKRNLLVFVTARLVNPAGLPIRPSDIRGLPDFRR